MSGIVQYVIVRGDLLTKLSWPVGALVAQACHAATAAIHLFYADEHTQAYLADLDNMHKVILEVTKFNDQKNYDTIRIYDVSGNRPGEIASIQPVIALQAFIMVQDFFFKDRVASVMSERTTYVE